MSAMGSLITLLRETIASRQATVAEIASVCGCSREHIYQLLREEQQPSFGLAEKIADAIGAEITVKTKKGRKKTA